MKMWIKNYTLEKKLLGTGLSNLTLGLQQARGRDGGGEADTRCSNSTSTRQV
jgi:hypothetical protein